MGKSIFLGKILVAILLGQGAFAAQALASDTVTTTAPTAAASEPISDQAPANVQKTFPKLTEAWSKNTLKGERNEFAVSVYVDKDGSLKYPDSATTVQIYNSSKNPALDQFAMDCIKQSGPYDTLGLIPGKSRYLVKFDVNEKTAVITELPDCDWGPYMMKLQRKIKQNWHPAKVDVRHHVQVSFKLHADGSMTDVKTIRSDVSPEVEKETLAGLIQAAPFAVFPQGAPDYQAVEFTFDFKTPEEVQKHKFRQF